MRRGRDARTLASRLVAATAGTLRVSGSSCLGSTSLLPRPTTASRAQLIRGWLGSARQCADTAKIALKLSMVLVVVFCLPQACYEVVQLEIAGSGGLGHQASKDRYRLLRWSRGDFLNHASRFADEAFAGFFSHFSLISKKCGVRPPVRR